MESHSPVPQKSQNKRLPRHSQCETWPHAAIVPLRSTASQWLPPSVRPQGRSKHPRYVWGEKNGKYRGKISNLPPKSGYHWPMSWSNPDKWYVDWNENWFSILLWQIQALTTSALNQICMLTPPLYPGEHQYIYIHTYIYIYTYIYIAVAHGCCPQKMRKIIIAVDPSMYACVPWFLEKWKTWAGSGSWPV